MCSFSGPSGSFSVSPSLPFDVPPVAVLVQMSDALPWPLLLLACDAALMHANLAARQLLHRGQPLKLDAGRRVHAAAAAQQTEFAAALQAGGPVLLQWPSPGGAYTLTLKPLAAAGDGDDGAPVLVVLSTSTARHADLQAFARMHKLSAAETRVLEALSLGRSIAATAAALGTQAATVRSQLTSLRRKSGYASVALLLQALAAMPPLATLHLVQPPRDGAGE